MYAIHLIAKAIVAIERVTELKKPKRAVKTKTQLLMELSAKKFETLKLSACWIARNEEKNLPRSMESVKACVDEMIVVDTGSTDRTVELAEGLGAKVYRLDWADDFSAPRNHAIEKATGDWIIFLDADEYFDGDSASNIRQTIQLAVTQKKSALLIELVNIDVDDGDKILDSTYLCRAFKGGARYVGRIHEELRLADGRQLTKFLTVPNTVMRIIHTGYSTTLNKEKAARNLKMLLSELEATEEPQRIYGYLAQCYNGLDDLPNAEKYARLDIDGGRKNSTFDSSSHRILISILSKEDTARLDERLEEAERAVRDFPSMPEFRAELAECLAAKGEYARAISEMKSAIKHFRGYHGLEPTMFDQSMAEFAAERVTQWSSLC